MMGKLKSSASKQYARGGNGSMVGKQSAGPVKPDHTMGHTNGAGKFAKGGPSGRMAKKTGAMPAKAC